MKTYTQILDFIKKNKIDTYRAFVATACDEAWDTLKEDGHLDNAHMITYDMFCNVCENLWLDCNEDTGLSVIADRVADFYAENDSFPENIEEIL